MILSPDVLVKLRSIHKYAKLRIDSIFNYPYWRVQYIVPCVFLYKYKPYYLKFQYLYLSILAFHEVGVNEASYRKSLGKRCNKNKPSAVER